MKDLRIVLLALFCLSASAKEFYVTVPASGAEDLKKLVEQGYDVGGIDVEKKTATLVVHESQSLRGLRVLSKREIGRPDALYKKPVDIERTLLQVADYYPHLVTVEKIGRTHDGRDIMAAHIASKFVSSTEPKKAVVFDAMHHAREIMTPEVALDIVDYLTKNYATDPQVQKWVNSYDIWVVPMVNPDGNHKVWNGSSMWRKNVLNGYGVDNNRNYPYEWNSCAGSSGSTSSDTYRGPSPASEPETQALMNLVKRVKPMFNISYHSYSEIVIYPFGCSPKKIPSPDREVYEGVGKDLAKKLVRDSGSGTYTAGTSYELLYNVDGGSIDWMYAANKTMAFVIEINSGSQGFQPSFTTWRDKTVEKQRKGWQYILERMEGPGLPSRG